MEAKKALHLCTDLEDTVKASHGRLTSEQRKKVMRNALKIKLDSLSALKKRDVERCDGRNGDRSKFYFFSAYCKACDILESL